MKSMSGWVQINQKGEGRPVFVQALHLPLVQFWKENNKKNHIYFQLTRQLFLLSGDAHSGASINISGTIRKKKLKDGSEIEYYIHDTAAFVRSIKLGDERLSISGLRRVEYDPARKGWVASSKLLSTMESSHKWSVDIEIGGSVKRDSAHFAAISGVYSDGEVAGHLLSAHVSGAYGNDRRQFNPKSVEVRGNYFSMLYINKGDHAAGVGAGLLADVIRQNAKADARVHTVVQGIAAKAFLDAAAKIGGELKGNEALSKQQFYFSNPEGVSNDRLKATCTALGVTFAGIRNNPFDVAQAARNSVSELYKMECGFKKAFLAISAVGGAINKSASGMVKAAPAGAAATAIAAGSGALNNFVGVSASSKLVNDIVLLLERVDSSPAAKAVLVAGGVCMLVNHVHKSHGKFLNLYNGARAMGKSTFGVGNQFWFDDKKAFYKVMA